MNKIRWCAIQPLTGGMYLGAENAIGHPAEFILSFPGLGDVTATNKETGEVTAAGNEYSLMKYLEKKNRKPDYRIFNRGMFDNNYDLDVELLESQWSKSSGPLDYSNMDLCVAVPVCSGLSNSSTSNIESRMQKNVNMLWITKYAICKIQPKVYIFENAPTFMGTRGEYIRKELEKLAKEQSYSIVYYKTDTKYHHNCQRRPRTFIIFFKQDNMNNIQNPELGFEHEQTTMDKYFEAIPADATQQVSLNMLPINKVYLAYYRSKFGDNWSDTVNSLSGYMIDNNLYDELCEFANNMPDLDEKSKQSCCKFFNHVKFKVSQGKGFYGFIAFKPIGNISSAIMFRTMQSQLHWKEERLLTIRENLWLMGMPNDFDLQGNVFGEYAKIGQNVPVKTAEFIVSQALNNIKNNPNGNLVRYFNNDLMKEMPYKLSA